MTAKRRTIWTFAITSAAVFMATLDNLVVTTALPVIRKDLHATVESLEWTVNAYTLTFAISTPAVGASAAAADASVKIPRPITSMRRRPKRSPSAAPVRRSTAKVSV